MGVLQGDFWNGEPEELRELLSLSKGDSAMTTTATITCPECQYAQEETMPIDVCQRFYKCRGCGAILSPKPGDCCVFCSYADHPCPSVQEGDGPCCD